MMIDEPEILDIKLLVSGEEDAPIELTPERYFWWHFWALWLHDALYCRWGMFSPSQARDITDRENYYNSLFGEQNRSEVLDMLDNLGVPAFKIASTDLNNLPLLEYVANKKKPMIISTAMSDMQEVSESVDVS